MENESGKKKIIIVNQQKKSQNLLAYFLNLYIYVFCSLTDRQADNIFEEWIR